MHAFLFILLLSIDNETEETLSSTKGRDGSSCPSLSTTSGDLSGSTSSTKQSAYPLSPSPPPTPHPPF